MREGASGDASKALEAASSAKVRTRSSLLFGLLNGVMVSDLDKSGLC